MNTLGDRIAESLKTIGLTQRELAKKIGVTEVSVSKYINNKRTPNGNIIAKMATALHTTSDYLLGTEKTETFDAEYYKIHRLIAHNASHMSIAQKKELVNALFESDDQKG